MTPHTDHASSPSRRRFLQWTGAAAAGLMALDRPLQAAEPAPHAQAIQLGVTSYSFRKLPLDEAIALTRQLGLKHFSLKSFHLPLNASPEHIAEVAARIRGAGLDLYGAGVISMHKPADVTQAFAYAKGLGLRVIMAMPTAALLPLIEQNVKEHNIMLAIHNHGPSDPNFPSPESAYRKVRNLDRRIGLCIDVGHTVKAGADPAECVLKYADRLLDVHMKDVSSKSPRSEEVIVGRGVIDVPALMKALVKVKYRGVVAFEYEPDPKHPLPGMAESVGYTRGVLAALA